MSAEFFHESVLAREAVALLCPTPGKLLLDGTLGGGGHAELLLAGGASVIAIDKEKSEITIRQRTTTNMQWTVAYTPATKFSQLNEKATLDQVKVGLRLICEGSFGKETNKMTAARIDVRTDK